MVVVLPAPVGPCHEHDAFLVLSDTSQGHEVVWAES